MTALLSLFRPAPAPAEDRDFLDRKPGLYLKMTETKGRGVFCVHDIKRDEELENTPALILNEREADLVNDTVVWSYVFSTGDLSEEAQRNLGIDNLEDSACIVMGIGSYCNHDETPNAEIAWEEKEGSLYYALRATRDIPAGTEICTSYGPTWFEERAALSTEDDKGDAPA